MISRTGILLAAVAVLVTAGAFTAWWMTRETGAPVAPRVETPTSAYPDEASGARPTSAPVTAAIKPRRFEPALEDAAPETAPDPAHLYVAGKVIDERRRVAPGASIELMIEGREPLRGKTGPDGRFRIGLGAKPTTVMLRGGVEATDARGRVALVSLPSEPVSGNVIDVGTLPLVEGGALTIRVLKDGKGVPGARVYLGSIQRLGFGPFVTDALGSLGPRRVPDGSHLVTAFSNDVDFRGEARVEIPRREGTPLEVSLAPAWRLTVTVKDAKTGKGIEGRPLDLMCTIRTEERSMTSFAATTPDPVPPTDAEGRSVILGLSMERPVTVDVVSPGASSPGRMFVDRSARAKADPGTAEVVITLGAGGETFTFPIVADETDGPPDGADLKLSMPEGYGGVPPPPTGKVVDRNVVVDGVGERTTNMLATAPDGSRAILRILGEARNTKVGSEAKFKVPRALVVTAHDRAGAPLTGQLVQCRTPGNSPVGPAVPIGADGAARIDGLYPQKVDVTLRRPGERGGFGGKAAGSADLTKPGDGHVDLIVEIERKCVLRVTVDGEKRLPPTFSVWMAGERGMFVGDVGPIEEDPAEATLRFGIRPDPKLESLKLNVTGKGCPPVIIPLVVPNDDSVLEGAAAFVTGAKVTIHVLPPADNIHQVALESWNAERSAWAPRGFRPDPEELGRKPTEIPIDALATGRYRARDVLTGLVSEGIDVVAGGAAEITLDLSRAGPITGRVEGPTDAGLESASVVIEGTGLVQPSDGPGFSRGIQVRLNSEFKARVPGDRPVTLRVTHPMLAAAAEGGSASVTAPGASVVLRLMRGAEAMFRVAGQPDRQHPYGFARESGRVLLFDGKVEGEPVQTCNVKFENGVGRIGGFKSGRYTLWCDVPPGAPLIIEGVALGEGVTDLGELEFAEGATVRVKVLTREGQEPPQVQMSSTPVAKPEYWRSGGSRAKGEVLLQGLGPGRFKVEIRAGDFRAAPIVHEVVSTGSGEIPLTVDLR